MLIQKGGCVYIISNYTNTVLYTGVTSDLRQRILEHREKKFPTSFSAKFNCYKLLWFEHYAQISDAIVHEKIIKGGSRKNKEMLITLKNPDWRDLWDEVKNW